MKFCVFLMLLLWLLSAQAVLSADAYLAWFTDANIQEGQKLAASPNPPPFNPKGTKGQCVDLTHRGVLSVPSLSNPRRGVISFWLRPKQDGLLEIGGSDHILIKAGDPTSNGLQVSWDNSKGVLRFTMAGKNGTAPKITSCRADISDWKANDWHHVQVAWLENIYNKPVGLAIWIDRVAVSSVVFGGTKFMDPPSGSGMSIIANPVTPMPAASAGSTASAPLFGGTDPVVVTPGQLPGGITITKSNIAIGDKSSQAYMDELIFRGNVVQDCWDTGYGGTPIAYRDYFRTAPYTSIQVTPLANRVSSDPWVLVGKKKQFGLIATRILNTSTNETTTEYITNFDQHYGQWSEFDAKPFIKWTSSSTSKAIVNSDGLVTGISATTTPILLNATFAGMKTGYSLSVRPWNDKPDLCLMYVERLPRYSKYSYKKWPAAGDTVTSVVHYGNFGFQPANNFSIKFELIPDSNNNFKLDLEETAVTIITRDITTALAVKEERTESFEWFWPENGLTTGSVFIRVTLDSNKSIDEVCEANNQRCEKSNARAFRWGYHPSKFSNDYSNRVVNLVGSFSDYDWYNAQADRASLMMRESVYPVTSPDGILDEFRVDNFIAWEEPDASPWHNVDSYYDGGFPQIDLDFGSTPMDIDSPNLHEIGHTSMGLPDLYGYPMTAYNMFLKDPSGQPYACSPLFPIVAPWDDIGMWSSGIFGYPDAAGVGYSPLMDSCHLWLDPMCAGLTNYYRQNRDRDYTWSNMAPRPSSGSESKNSLLLLDRNDNPLANAAVYMYQCVNTGYLWASWNKYYPDRPKFAGNSGSDGVYIIPTTTAPTWDDWKTDTVEKAVTCKSPFDYTYGPEGPSWQWGEMMLLKIVGANGEVEFQVLPFTDVNVAFFENVVNGGSSNTPAQYIIRTSLTSAASPVEIVLPTIPTEIQTINRRPVAGIVGGSLNISVPAYKNYTLDATASYDPEGQPLYYWWGTPSKWTRNPVVTEYAGGPGAEYECLLYVSDGLRYSDQITIRVTTY